MFGSNDQRLQAGTINGRNLIESLESPRSGRWLDDRSKAALSAKRKLSPTAANDLIELKLDLRHN